MEDCDVTTTCATKRSKSDPFRVPGWRATWTNRLLPKESRQKYPTAFVYDCLKQRKGNFDLTKLCFVNYKESRGPDVNSKTYN